MRPNTILIVDDEKDIQTILSLALKQSHFNTLCANNSSEAIEILEKQTIDLILLDWMLPGLSGIQWLKQLRLHSKYAHIPIIMISAKGTLEDKLKGLETGCDDYICKPFSTREIVLKIKAILKRTRHPNPQHLKNIWTDSDQCKAHFYGHTIQLSHREFELLSLLIQHPHQILSRNQILDHIWPNDLVEDRTVDVLIQRVRRLLEPIGASQCIQTVRGLGYQFVEEAYSEKKH